jgi:hypothetical protein
MCLNLLVGDRQYGNIKKLEKKKKKKKEKLQVEV